MLPGPLFNDGDFNGDGYVTGADYTLWADHFGESQPGTSVPEPDAWILLSVAGACFALVSSRR